MEYRVRLTARAQRDLAALYGEVDAERSRTAQRWYEGLKKAILSLEKQPKVWPTTRESSQLRHLIYGSKPHGLYRVIYRIDERQELVDVLHIRHGARQEFRPSDLK